MEVARPCELCGSTNRIPRYFFKGIRVVKCARCGLVFGHPDREVDARDLYDSRYFEERKEYFFSTLESGKAPAATGGPAKSFQEGLELLGAHRKQGRLLDVGCAVGSFLSLAQADGWEVHGVDVSEYATSCARNRLGAAIHTGDLVDAGFPESYFDVVTLWDVVEHLAHPRSVLSEVHRILKGDGILLLDTPNEEALIRRIAFLLYHLFGRQVTYPASKLYHVFHRYYFSENTLGRLLTECGFEIIQAKRKPIPREKGRGTPWERTIVKAFGVLERPLGMDFELLVLARRKRAAGTSQAQSILQIPFQPATQAGALS